jgi:hypothetical protein
VGDLFVLVPWLMHGSGDIPEVRLVIFCSLWVIFGIQICFSSFFLSMIGISRGTWIGQELPVEEQWGG